MSDAAPSGGAQNGSGTGPEDFGHPRGTLAIVIIFGVLFALGWFGMYVFGYLARGGLHP
jgi:hypothetical protein